MAGSSRTIPCCPSPASSSDFSNRPPASSGETSSPPSSAPLLERALDPTERHTLGAHFTPRAYVERLVLPTVIEPLREEWDSVRAAAVALANRGEIRQSPRRNPRLPRLPLRGASPRSRLRLRELPLRHPRTHEAPGRRSPRHGAAFGATQRLDLSTHTVDPHQFLGLELNPRAASIAELVLWIGYLQWQARAAGTAAIGEPVLEKLDNIQCRDAVLAYDGEPQPVTWAMAAANPSLPGLPDQARQQGRAGSPLPAERPQGAHGVRPPHHHRVGPAEHKEGPSDRTGCAG